MLAFIICWLFGFNKDYAVSRILSQVYCLMPNPIILIPARMASSRLPDKPLADIAGKPMIAHMVSIAHRANLGKTYVACDGDAIARAVERAGGVAVLTDPALPSGSDRIHQALRTIDPDQKHDIIINLQGDMPTLDPQLITRLLALMDQAHIDIATLAAPITEYADHHDPAIVKPIIAFNPDKTRGKALYFTRTAAPHGQSPLYHHIGLYAYRRAALDRFVSLPPSPLEQCEKLEQLRALEAGMHIEIAIVDTIPLGVDTEETLQQARTYYES